MRLRITHWMMGLAAGTAAMAVADAAAAQCSSGCTPPPTPCCEAPPPPPPPPPPPVVTPCCGVPPAPPSGGGWGGGVNVNVNVNNNINTNVNGGARSSANASASAAINARSAMNAGGWGGRGGYGLGWGGGGSAFVSVDQPAPTTISGMAVEGLVQTVRTPVTAYRRMMKRTVIQAVCIDDRQVPHPASQVRPDREVSEGYEGELYRCLSGTWLQATLADYTGNISFDHGTTLTCRKREALWYGADGRLECRPEKPERDCNERSLLRRYGAGVKILNLYREEEYTEYEERLVEASVITGSIMLDGGVGGRVF